MGKPLKVMIVAGEDSGDRHAAAVIESLKKRLQTGSVDAFGATGPKMRAAGVRTIVESDDFGIVGVPEVIKAVPMFLGVMKKLVESCVDSRPDLVILVDFPEFNLKLAKKLKKRGFNIVYYISPQLWAWRQYRVRTIRKYVDLLLSILPFELTWYSSRGVDHVRYVGHPLGGKVHPEITKTAFCEKAGLDSSKPIIAMLPGSRSREIEHNLPVMLQGAKRLQVRQKGIQFVIPLARSRRSEMVDKMIKAEEGPLTESIRVIVDDTYSALGAADAAVVTSGTATLETALLGIPQVIVYKASLVNYLLLRPLIAVEFFGLANLIAGKELFRELIQNEFSPESLSDEPCKIA